jgi:hypothetical protein
MWPWADRGGVPCHLIKSRRRLKSRRPLGVTRRPGCRSTGAFSLFPGAVPRPTEGRLVVPWRPRALSWRTAGARGARFLTETAVTAPIIKAHRQPADAHPSRAGAHGAAARATTLDGLRFQPDPEASNPSRLDDFGRAVLDRRHASGRQARPRDRLARRQAPASPAHHHRSALPRTSAPPLPQAAKPISRPRCACRARSVP